MPQTQSDINAEHILVRFLPKGWRPFAALIRLDRPIGTYLAFLPALMGLNLATHYAPQQNFITWLKLLSIFFLGAWLMRSAGCVWNDWLDRNLDRQVARTQNRPIAAGQISPKTALMILCLLLALSAALLLFLPIDVLWAVWVIVPAVLLYPMMKRWVDIPQLWLGITFNSGVWVAWLSIHGPNNLLPPLLLYLGCIFWTAGYDTVYALQDVQDDKKTGIRSMARLLENFETIGISILYIFCCAFWSALLYGICKTEVEVDLYSISISIISFVCAWCILGFWWCRWYRQFRALEPSRNTNDFDTCCPDDMLGNALDRLAFHGIFFRQNAFFGLVISVVWI